jgi:iron complex outermembrane recepter protein
MRKIFLFFFTMALALIFESGLNSYASARETAKEEFTLEEITVTAEKRVENVQKTSIAVTSVSGDDMKEKSFDKLENVLANVPGLSLQATAPTGSGVYIRGIGSNVNTNIADPSVAINVDGVYFSKGEVAFSTMYDTERVEVLRGPQGTLYGRNAIGGTVNVLSKNPKGEVDAAVNFKLGNYNLREIDAMINIPITETFWSRFAIMKQDRDGYYTDGGDSADKAGFRAKFLYTPTDKLSALFTADLTSDESKGKPQVAIPGSAGKIVPFMPWTVDVSRGWGPYMDTSVIRNPWTTDSLHPYPLQDNWFQTYSLNIDYDFSWGTMTIFPSVNKDRRDFVLIGAIFGTATGETAQSALQISRPYEETQYALEFRLQNPSDSLIKWAVGYNWMKSRNNTEGNVDPIDFTSDPTPGTMHITVYDQPQTTNAFFAQVTYPVTNSFRVTAGARMSTDDRTKKFRFGVPSGLTAANEPYFTLGGSNGSYQTDLQTFNDSVKNTTWKGGVEFDLSDSSMLYAQVTTGFKAGGLNTNVVPLTTFKPEELTSYSIGSKNRFLQNRLQVNAEAYYYDYKNFQLMTGSAAPNFFTGVIENVNQYVINAKSGKLYGGELETDYMFTESDLFNVGLSWQHTEYGSVILPFNPFTGTPPTDIKGQVMSNSPKWTASIGYNHTVLLSSDATILIGLRTKFSAGYFTSPEETLPGAWQKNYHLSDLSATYSPANGKWNLGVWCNNIENEAQTIQVYPLYRQIISNPRTVGLSLNLKL